MIETIPHTSTLAERLRERIRREGSITFCDWMRAALYDSSEGYYCRENQTKWGREGDYRTSPERSALFAQTFARYFARLYEELDRPAEWTIVEVGAGDGTFARGVLQTLQEFSPHVFSATRYVLDEVSPQSSAVARERLEPFADRAHFRRLNDAELNPGIVFSNELLDAFPVHRVSMERGQLREFYVNVAADGGFEWTVGSLSTPLLTDYFAECGIKLEEGQVAEVNFAIKAWLDKVARQMRNGYVISVDYGAEAVELYASPARHQGTLRAFYRHQLVDDLLALPGEQDLTTTVDWTFVKRIGERLGLEVVEFEQQDKFLLAAGLLDQLEAQSQRSKNQAEKLRLSTAAREMILPGGMASSFQVLVQRKSS
jgi:SAM-dependent MidA family methyltransferase